MLCCAAVMLVLGLLREAWFRLPGTTRPFEPGFAPVARRPMPGAAVPTVSSTPATAVRRPARLRPGFVAFTVGVATYAVLVTLLFATGAADRTSPSAPIWQARGAGLAVLAVAALALARQCRPRGIGSRHELWSARLVGAGAAWWLLGLVDMHVLGLVELTDPSLGADLLFHSPGAVMILAGTLARLPQPPKELRRVR